jgi:hypothetical protein
VSSTSSFLASVPALYKQVALSAVTILGLATLLSVWHSDVSGSLALLGLLSIYLSSSELLVLVGGEAEEMVMQ